MNGQADESIETGSPAVVDEKKDAGAKQASEEAVFGRLASLVTEVTGVGSEEIAMESVLVTDLGAESIDLLDLSFLIEEEFGITIEPNEFESRARRSMPGIEYEKDGYLTAEALAELRRALPEIAPRRLTTGLRKMDLPNLLTVAVFVHLIQRKLAVKSEGEHDA